MIPTFEDNSKNICCNKNLQAVSFGNDWFVKLLRGKKNEKVESVPKILTSLKDHIWVQIKHFGGYDENEIQQQVYLNSENITFFFFWKHNFLIFFLLMGLHHEKHTCIYLRFHYGLCKNSTSYVLLIEFLKNLTVQTHFVQAGNNYK